VIVQSEKVECNERFAYCTKCKEDKWAVRIPVTYSRWMRVRRFVSHHVLGVELSKKEVYDHTAMLQWSINHGCGVGNIEITDTMNIGASGEKLDD